MVLKILAAFGPQQGYGIYAPGSRNVLREAWDKGLTGREETELEEEEKRSLDGI